MVEKESIECGAYTLGQMCKRLNLGRSAGYSAVQRGLIPCRRIGKIIRIPRWWVEQKLRPEEGAERGGDPNRQVAVVGHLPVDEALRIESPQQTAAKR